MLVGWCIYFNLKLRKNKHKYHFEANERRRKNDFKKCRRI